MLFYSVTPESTNDADPDGSQFEERLLDRIRHADGGGFEGMLVPHSLHEIDPWMLAGRIGNESVRLRPLVAAQPGALTPHTAAQMAAAFWFMYRRPIDFNLVAGADPTELRSVGDTASKEERYERLQAWATILRRLLRGEIVRWEDRFFQYRGLRLRPYAEGLGQCRIFMAGSSELSQRVAADVADVAVTHPVPAAEWRESTVPGLHDTGFRGELGIRIGIIARNQPDAAWEVARGRFPRSWRGDQETKLKTVSPNSWARELARRAVAEVEKPNEVYWLGAFASGGASAPLLVGSHEQVASALLEYMDAGAKHVILANVGAEDEEDAKRVLDLVARRECDARRQ